MLYNDQYVEIGEMRRKRLEGLNASYLDEIGLLKKSIEDLRAGVSLD
jgi:hypothetical protein